jgi:UDP-N-acetylglucosamine--N-acetylmuramyl-(pentapeptide) pyrophosphoryl-undecaprenol N-acetylglucosamine transferase
MRISLEPELADNLLIGFGVKEVHYYVHGRGRGHATRALSVIPALKQAGYQLKVFAGRAALPLLSQCIRCGPIHSLMPGELFLTLPKLLQRSVWACTRGLRISPLAVISDGDLPSSVASSLAGIPVIAIGHGLIFSHCERPEGVDSEAWAREAKKATRASRGSVRQVPVSFCPLSTNAPSTTLARPPLSLPERRRQGRGGVVCYFRDDNARHVLTALRACGVTPIVFSDVAESRAARVPGVRYERMQRQRFVDALAEADAVVSSAGHQLINEALHLGLPHLALYAAHDDEQRLNVELLRAARLGDGAPLESVDRAHVLHFLGRLPELGSLRTELALNRSLPRLDDVVVNLLAQFEQGAPPRVQRSA